MQLDRKLQVFLREEVLDDLFTAQSLTGSIKLFAHVCKRQQDLLIGRFFAVKAEFLLNTFRHAVRTISQMTAVYQKGREVLLLADPTEISGILIPLHEQLRRGTTKLRQNHACDGIHSDLFAFTLPWADSHVA